MASDRAFLGVTALLFLGSAALTIAWCGSMSVMPGMEMPGGWTMSMAWMRMPGLFGMIAMMLPAVLPALRHYRRAVAGPRADTLTARVAAAYFLVWASSGALIFAIGIALADVEMRLPAVARVVPTLVSLVLLIAGALQLSRWKERRLACCRRSSGCPASGADAGTAWRHGFDLGLKCCACCAPLTAMLLVVGVMDLGAMAAASVAIALERLVPRGRRIARASGILLFAAGLTMLAGTQL